MCRIGGCADSWSKAELGWNVTMTENHHDEIAVVRIAIAEDERLVAASAA